MRDRLPTWTAKEILAALQRAGWYIHHSTGSRRHLRHPEKPGPVLLLLFTRVIYRALHSA